MAGTGSNSSSATSFSLKACTITAYDKDGREIVRNIRNLVVQIDIIESLYSPSLSCDVLVRDGINLMEWINLCGQEKLYLEFEKDGKSHTLNFVITEYPIYSKSENGNIQGYRMTGISEHAYISGSKTISRSFGSGKLGGINQSLIKLLSLVGIPESDIIIEGDNVSRSRGIIPWMSVLNACEFLKNISYDREKSPFYLYQTMDGTIHFSSHAWLMGGNNPKYGPIGTKGKPTDYFELFSLGEVFQGTEKEHLRSKSRIEDIASNLAMSKYTQMRSGAYGSTLYEIDPSQKTFVKNIYQYREDALIHMNDGGAPLISDKFKVGNISLPGLIDSKIRFINTNSQLFENNENSIGDDIKSSVLTGVSYTSLIENIVQDFSLAGDFSLNPGKKIGLRFQRAIDEKTQKDICRKMGYEFSLFDKKISGNYLVTGVVHKFNIADSIYRSHIRAKKDK